MRSSRTRTEPLAARLTGLSFCVVNTCNRVLLGHMSAAASSRRLRDGQRGCTPSKKGGFAFFLLLACIRHLLISTSRPRFLSSPTSLACHTLVTSQIQHSTNTRISNFRQCEPGLRVVVVSCRCKLLVIPQSLVSSSTLQEAF